MDVPIPEVWQDLSALQRDILTVLALDSPSSMTDVQRQIGGRVTLKAVAQNVRQLEAQEYVVVRQADDDGRYQQCALTAIGRETVHAGVVDIADDVQTRLAATVAGPEAEDRGEQA